MSNFCVTLVLLGAALQGEADGQLSARSFYVPENPEYTITDSVIDSIRFTLERPCGPMIADTWSRSPASSTPRAR